MQKPQQKASCFSEAGNHTIRPGNPDVTLRSRTVRTGFPEYFCPETHCPFGHRKVTFQVVHSNCYHRGKLLHTEALLANVVTLFKKAKGYCCNLIQATDFVWSFWSSEILDSSYNTPTFNFSFFCFESSFACFYFFYFPSQPATSLLVPTLLFLSYISTVSLPSCLPILHSAFPSYTSNAVY